MEHLETATEEQGQVSAPGESPKDENQNTYTEEETSLAVKYQVEPKTVRLIAEIVSVHTEGINKLIGLMQGKKEQAEPEQVEAPEQPAELSIDQRTQERLKSFYKNLDPKTKLAILTLSEIQCLDGINFQFSKKEGRLYDEIWDDMQSVCLETFHKEPDQTALGVIDSVARIGEPNEDVWLCGVWEAVRMVTQNC